MCLSFFDTLLCDTLLTSLTGFLEEAERLQNLVVDDAGALFDQFDQAFRRVANDLPKPNVLLTGITGAGKSSLINAVFGQKLAATGTGVPITQHFT